MLVERVGLGNHARWRCVAGRDVGAQHAAPLRGVRHRVLAMLKIKRPAGNLPAFGKCGIVTYCWPEAPEVAVVEFAASSFLKSASVPTTLPLRVPGIKLSFSGTPDLASAMVTRLGSRVRPMARS